MWGVEGDGVVEEVVDCGHCAEGNECWVSWDDVDSGSAGCGCGIIGGGGITDVLKVVDGGGVFVTIEVSGDGVRNMSGVGRGFSDCS